MSWFCFQKLKNNLFMFIRADVQQKIALSNSNQLNWICLR